MAISRSALCAVMLLAACGGREGANLGGTAACSAVAACGGDPTGTWQVTAGCFEFPAPSQCPGGLIEAPADAGVPFVFNGALPFGTPGGVLQTGEVTFRSDNTYGVSLGVSFAGTAHFSPACFQAAGLPVSCDALSSAIYASTSTPAVMNGMGPTIPAMPSPLSVTCTPASDGGCDCRYTQSSPSVAPHGTWVRLASGTIETTEGYEFDFCATDNQLDINDNPAGAASLFDVPGLDTLALTRVANPGDGGGEAAPQSLSAQLPAVAAALVCPSVAGCGGDPTGTWQGAVCLDAPLPVPAGPPCDNLVFLTSSAALDAGTLSGQVEQLDLPHGSGTTLVASVTFNSDQSYTVAIDSSQADTVHFAPYCLTAWGANPSCDDLEQQVNIYDMATVHFLQSFACTTAADGGCDCSYSYFFLQEDVGNWSAKGNGLTLASATSSYDGLTETVFCKSVAELQIATAPGSSLAGLGPGTLTLTPMVPCPTICSGTCVNEQTDPNNCGGCGKFCEADAGGDSCVGGVCTPN